MNLLMGVCWSGGVFAFPFVVGATEFEPPVRMTAGGAVIQTEQSGHAAPCWADFDGDGKKDLLVGQFRKGKIKFYKNNGSGKLAAGVWVQAGGKPAEIPGVW